MSAPNSKLLILASAAGAFALGAAWLGASYYSSSRIDAEIKAFAALPSAQTGVRIVDLQHKAGFPTSTGTVRFQPQINDPSVAPGDVPIIEASYSLSHLLMPTSAARVTWTLKPTGMVDSILTMVLGSPLQIKGDGRLTYGGGIDTKFALPEIAVSQDGMNINSAPVTGHLAAAGKALEFGLALDKLSASGNGETVNLTKLALDLDVADRTQGLGTTSLTFDKFSATDGSAEGYRHLTEVSRKGDEIEISNSDTLDKLVVAGQTLSDLELKLAIGKLDAASLLEISTLASETDGLQTMTPDQNTRLRKSLRTLVAKGVSIGIPALSGTVGKGSFKGEMLVELRPAPSASGPVVLAPRLAASGNLVVKGDIIPAEQAQMAISSGAVKSGPDGLKAEFRFADGVLKANGAPVDASSVQMALGMADSTINDILDGKPLMPAPAMDAPAAEAPLAEAPSAEAPAAAPAPGDLTEEEIIAAESGIEDAAPAAPAAAPAGDAASRAEITRALVGNTVEGTMQNGSTYKEFYARDGSIRTEDGAAGTWRFSGDRMCFTYGNEGESCLGVTLAGRTLGWLDDNGSNVGAGEIQRGNPNKF